MGQQLQFEDLQLNRVEVSLCAAALWQRGVWGGGANENAAKEELFPERCAS